MSGAILAAGMVQLTDMFIHFVNLGTCSPRVLCSDVVLTYYMILQHLQHVELENNTNPLDPQFSYLAGRPSLLHNATHRQNIPASCLAVNDRRDDAEKYTN